MTTDIAAAAEFYTALLGWRLKPLTRYEPNLLLCSHDTPIATVARFDSPNRDSHWVPYIRTPKVELATDDVAGLHGHVAIPPFQLPGFGRVATFIDPGGAFFHAVTAAKPRMKEFRWNPPETGPRFMRDELRTSDPLAVAGFYQHLFGYAASAHSRHMLLGTGRLKVDEVLATITTRGEHAPGEWLPWIGVRDLDATTARVAQLGGTHEGPGTLPETQLVQDPSGARFVLAALGPLEAPQ